MPRVFGAMLSPDSNQISNNSSKRLSLQQAMRIKVLKSITYKNILIDHDFISFNRQKNLIRLSEFVVLDKHQNDSVCNELCELRLKLNLLKSITYKNILIDRDFIFQFSFLITTTLRSGTPMTGINKLFF